MPVRNSKAVLVHMTYEAADGDDSDHFVHMTSVEGSDMDELLLAAVEFDYVARGYVRGYFPQYVQPVLVELEESARPGVLFPYGSVTGRRKEGGPRVGLAKFKVQQFDLDTDEAVAKYEKLVEEHLGHELGIEQSKEQ